MVRPPASVRVGPHRWTIHFAPLAAPDEYGQTDQGQLTITLAPGNAAAQDRETLLHEVIHAAWCSTALVYRDAEQERIVQSLAPLLYGALRDNPRLVAYLLARE